MDSLPLNSNAADLPHSARAPRQWQLLDLLISDAANDVDVVARELRLQGEMCERLRRALDRMACEQSVLETVCTEAIGADRGGATADLRVREAVELLAREWPEEYPAGAVEWLIAAGK
ncbi:hypothetical protein PQQ81_08865 [Paraburkholderia strydomiana]|uniref:hypothetical protein n=1 Tax=Paraburkholderia strydomiana TaxID=1245417 RepID=UPI0038BBFFB0